MADTIKEIADQLSRIFRHMLPGLVVLGGTAAAYPSWFEPLRLSDPWNITVLAAISVAAGNAWYVLHRYTIHQFFDWILYLIREGKAPGYLPWLSSFLDDRFAFARDNLKLSEHLHFRSSQIILMFILGEVTIFFAFQHESGSFFANNKAWLCLVGVVVFMASMVQYRISNELDIKAVKKWKSTRVSPNDGVVL